MSTTLNDLLRNSIYVGINLEDILYGVELVLYFKTMYALLNRSGKCTRSDVFYAVFSSAMLLMATIWVSTQAIFGQKMWLVDTYFQNHPGAVLLVNIWGWYMDMASMSLIMLQLMTDALMVYRCWMLWNNYRIIIIPLILWTGTLVLGILVGWTYTVYGGYYSHGTVVQLSLAYYSISVILTAMLTCMICYHLVGYGRLMREHLGREHASIYFAIAALVVESVLPYTVSGISFLISLGIGNQTEMTFGYVHALVMCISPQMLILRVATRAVTNDTGTRQPPSTVKFSPREETMSGRVSNVSNVVFAQIPGPAPKGDDSIV